MAWLDNSGDIIIDVVLTDLGRKILAKGDGSFRIDKFSVSDDEIDYTLYDSSDSRGSAYYDLEIMQTPIFEAFTNNAATMKSKLISIPRNNLLYLPEIRINDIFDASTDMYSTYDLFVVCVDEDTETSFGGLGNGILLGENPTGGGGKVRVDQGLNTTELSPTYQLDPDLVETQYVIEMDSRFGSVVEVQSGNPAVPSSVDDDYIAFYNLTLNTDVNYVKKNTDTTTNTTKQIISGPRGTYMEMKLKASIDLNSSTHLFTTLGTLITAGSSGDIFGTAPSNYYFIDSVVRVSGGTTGQVLDIPVRWIKAA